MQAEEERCDVGSFWLQLSGSFEEVSQQMMGVQLGEHYSSRVVTFRNELKDSAGKRNL